MHPPRINGFPYRGLHRCFLTFCTEERRTVFVSVDVVELVLSQFRQSAANEDMSITAFCFMRDHVHLLVTARTEGSDMRRFAADAKQRTAYNHSRLKGERLWQRGYYDHVLRDDESALAVIKYIVSNPVRAGFTRVLGEYPFCGSDEFSLEEIAACSEMWTPARRRRQP